MTKHDLDTGAAQNLRHESDVLNKLSHDIRAAMSDVLGGLRLIEPGRLEPQTLTQFERVRAAADTLGGLIDHALLEAAGQGVIAEPARDIHLLEWVAALTHRWSGRAVERGSTLDVRVAENLPLRVKLGPLLLDRLIGNLVGNALHHAPGVPVEVRVEAFDGPGLAIEVRDGGPGFPVSILQALGANEPTRAQGAHAGSGLGLGIVRDLSSQVGATIAFENDSTTGGGVVRVVLPEVLLDWSGAGQAPLLPPDMSGLSILVAEDNATNRLILQSMLAEWGADVTVVGDGVAAMEALEEAPFDLALIDIEMPKMDGLQVMARARKMPSPIANMPMIAITAYVLRDNREAIYAAGADGIIGKPIASGAEFGRTLMRYVGRPTGQPEPDDIARQGRGADMLPMQMDHERLDVLLQTAGPEQQTELLERLGEDLHAVQMALDGAVESLDIAEIRAQTHILIAISGAVGADRLCQLSEVLNIAAKRRRVDQVPVLYQEVRCDLRDLITLVAALPRPCA